MRELPGGTLTLLFTDIEGSTELLRRLGDRFGELLADVRRILRTSVGEHGGIEVDNQGDAWFFAFTRARDAVAAAVMAQRGLVRHEWPDGLGVRVRMGLHTGEPTVGEEGYIGLDVVRAARLGAAAAGGQILLSATTRSLVERDLPDGVAVADAGVVAVKPGDQPEEASELVVDDLPRVRPPADPSRPLLADPERYRELADRARSAIQQGVLTQLQEDLGGLDVDRPRRTWFGLPPWLVVGVIAFLVLYGLPVLVGLLPR